MIPASALHALSNETRVEIVKALATPQRTRDLRVIAPRPLTRQALNRHLQILMEAQLIQRIDQRPGRDAVYVLDHARLHYVFATLQLLEPDHASPVARGEPMAWPVRPTPLPTDGAYLVLLEGARPTRVHMLDGGATSWWLGAAPDCDVRLVFDPCVNAHHARLSREDGALFLRDEGSTSGTFVNGERLAVGAPRPLDHGDLVEMGLSRLLLRAAR